MTQFDFTATDTEAELGKLDPDFARLNAKMGELLQRNAALREARIALVDRRPADAATAFVVAKPAVPDRHMRAAAELLGDLAETVIPAPPAGDNAAGEFSSRLRQIAEEEAAVDRAIRLLRDPLRRARARAELAAWELIAPDFDRVVAEYVAAARALETAGQQVLVLRDKLTRFQVPAPYPLSFKGLTPLSSGANPIAALVEAETARRTAHQTKAAA